MNISDSIKYSFDQLQTGITAFIGDVELKMQNICPEIPVFVIETGQESYWLTKKFEEMTNRELYNKVPRINLNLTDIQYNSDENTNQYNKIFYKYVGKVYTCTARRLATNLSIDFNFVTSNFIDHLSSFEIMSTMNARPEVFTYEFLGNTLEAAYAVSTNSEEKPTMDVGSNSRNWNLKMSYDLQIHLLVPRIETIKELSDVDFNVTLFDLNVRENDGTISYEDKMELFKSDLMNDFKVQIKKAASQNGDITDELHIDDEDQ